MKKKEMRKMKIGIIGPQSSCFMIEKSLYEIDHTLEVQCFPKEQVNTCGEVIEECEEQCDATLFTGCAIESYVKSVYDLTKPYTAVEKSIISVSSAFLEMQKKQMLLDAFSIDVVENQVIEDLLDAFHILARNIYSCSFQPGVEEQAYVDWHIRLQEEGKTNVALTSFVWVSRELSQKGYHVIYLGPTRAMVRSALGRLKSKYALSQAEYAMIAVEILRLTNYERTSENYYNDMLKKADTEKEIVRYVEGVQGVMFSTGEKEYIVFGNAGVIKDVQNQNNLVKLQEKISTSGVSFDAGIGMGVTAYQAESNARKALEFTMKKKKGEIFCIDENKVCIGPVGMEKKLEYELISSDPWIQEIADRTRMSTRSILKIIAIAETRKSFVFDAHELAACLDITVRSARRIMNKIMDAGLGKVYAKETTVMGGRPKALIEILFKEEKSENNR